MNIRTLAALLILAGFAGSDAAAESRATGAVFRDCVDCPQMVVLPGEKLAAGRYEITAAEFAFFLAETKRELEVDCAYFDGDTWTWSTLTRDDRHLESRFGEEPAVCLEWEEAQAYARWLSERTGRAYRLPTGDEWEYAARGGSAATYHFGEAAAGLCEYGNLIARDTLLPTNGAIDAAWRNSTCSDGFAGRTSPVGRYRPNAYGLYDTIGNVREWTTDCGSREDCNHREVRGGSWISPFLEAQSAKRTSVHGSVRSRDIGFRLIRDLDD